MKNVEEVVKNNPEEFEQFLKEKELDMVFAFGDLFQKLDIVIWGAVSEYAAAKNVESNVFDVKTYKTMNVIITKFIDRILKKFLEDKRKRLDVEFKN